MDYRKSLSALTNVLRCEATGDATQDLLIFLAMAATAFDRVEVSGLDVMFLGRPLALPAISRAFREALQIRSTAPNDFLIEGPLSKYGRIIDLKFLQSLKVAQ